MAVKAKKIPMRMCIACREVKDKREMLRIVRTPDGEIKIDKTGKAAGRGAYICGEESCIKKLKKQKILSRVFECAVDDAVYDGIEREFDDDKK